MIKAGFPPVGGQTMRAECEGGALSADCGALLLRGSDRQIGLTERLAAAIRAKRHQASRAHPLRDLLAQRLSQSAAGSADAHDAKRLRRDPVYHRGVERSPLEPTHECASAPTFARLAHHRDRQDLSRLTQACGDSCSASDAEPPAAMVLARDHADDPT